MSDPSAENGGLAPDEPNLKSEPEADHEDARELDTFNNETIYMTSPLLDCDDVAEKVRFILCDGDVDGDTSTRLNQHKLFTQMNVLCHFPNGKTGWKELSRWLKYEEKVDAGGRWSKPHVSTMSYHALVQLQRSVALNQCAVALDITAASGSPAEIYELMVDVITKKYNLNPIVASRILEVLQRPHKHKHRKVDTQRSDEKDRLSGKRHAVARRTVSLSSSRRKSLIRREGKDLWAIYTAYPKGVTPDNLKPYKPNKKMMKKLPVGTEVANVLVGQLDFLSEPIMAFCRLDPPIVMADASEVALPTRFMFLALGRSPMTTLWEFSEIGRVAAVLFNDKVFCEVAYKAQSVRDLQDGIDEFIDDLTVLPPSIWDPSTRLDPPTYTMTPDGINQRLTESGRRAAKTQPAVNEGTGDDETLQRTGRIFGGLCTDARKRYRHMKSDFLDGLNLQCVASTVFLYFACITPIVTFGGLMEHKTDGYMGTIEMLLSGAICGVIYALFSGQPLTIVGATGPLLVFESIVFEICRENDIAFMSFRFWVGMWIFAYLMLMVAFDLSALVRFITRFTEECFAVLISVIFIYEAVSKLVHIWGENPVHVGVIREDVNFTCRCTNSGSSSYNSTFTGSLISSASSFELTGENRSVTLRDDCVTNSGQIEVRHGCISRRDCVEYGWELEGEGCVPTVVNSVPDVFLLSCVLLFGTFAVAIFFRNLRTTRYFPMQVRSTVADFAVFLSVVLWTGVDALFGLQTSKLNVPETFQTTKADRGWFIDPSQCKYWWLALLAALPGVLATILIFLDQQITAVIVNRKEHKLAKGHGYHLDLLVLAVLVAVCSVLGLPWFCAATVRSISHVQSLVRESEVKAPGEKPMMLGIREQRVTGICIHLLIGASTFCAIVLKYIPMPVLYGVFLYMGITSLAGVQFIERIMILFMPIKYQPDYIYLRHVQTSRVHAFTIIQILCSALMWILKSIKVTSIAFPIMLLALMAVRKGMDYIFTQRDLYWLDHLLPDEHRRKREDLMKSMEEAARANKRRVSKPFDDRLDVSLSKEKETKDELDIVTNM